MSIKNFFAIAVLLITNSILAQSLKRPTIAGNIEANGISIAYEIFGAQNKETILLICGTGSQLTDWSESFCGKLAGQGYRVIRFDNRDVGLSSKFDSLGAPNWAAIIPKIKTCDMSDLPYTLRDMAEDAVSLLDALKIKKAHIVGISMGGAIAQLVAIMHPHRTLSLTSINASSGNPELPPGDSTVISILGAPPPVSDETGVRVQYLYNIYSAMDSKVYPTEDSVLLATALRNVKRSWYPEGAARQAATVLLGDNCYRKNELRDIKVPVAIIHGGADPVVNVEAARELANIIPDAKLFIIPGMSHGISEPYEDKVMEGIYTVVKN